MVKLVKPFSRKIDIAAKMPIYAQVFVISRLQTFQQKRQKSRRQTSLKATVISCFHFENELNILLCFRIMNSSDHSTP